jgi:hypothetical protein
MIRLDMCSRRELKTGITLEARGHGILSDPCYLICIFPSRPVPDFINLIICRPTPRSPTGIEGEERKPRLHENSFYRSWRLVTFVEVISGLSACLLAPQ